jgi:DNA-3-methyladenine glycosylase
MTAAARATAGPGVRAVLPREFFDRPAAEVAPALLGCVLARDSPEGLVAAVIVETEAYAGQADPASHAFRGRTARNAVMFGPGGHAYVYFTYGMHYCVNLVSEGEGQATAVLLRAGRIIEGAGLAAARRSGGGQGTRSAGHPSAGPRERDLARGPARLCQAMAIDRALNGADVCDPLAPLRICGPVQEVPAAGISRGPRVGVSRAAEVQWRFWITGDPCVSAYRPYQARRAVPKPVTGSSADGGTIAR